MIGRGPGGGGGGGGSACPMGDKYKVTPSNGSGSAPPAPAATKKLTGSAGLVQDLSNK